MAHPAYKLDPHDPEVHAPPAAPVDVALLFERILDDCADEPRTYARRTTVEGGAE